MLLTWIKNQTRNKIKNERQCTFGDIEFIEGTSMQIIVYTF